MWYRFIVNLTSHTCHCHICGIVHCQSDIPHLSLSYMWYRSLSIWYPTPVIVMYVVSFNCQSDIPHLSLSYMWYRSLSIWYPAPAIVIYVVSFHCQSDIPHLSLSYMWYRFIVNLISRTCHICGIVSLSVWHPTPVIVIYAVSFIVNLISHTCHCHICGIVSLSIWHPTPVIVIYVVSFHCQSAIPHLSLSYMWYRFIATLNAIPCYNRYPYKEVPLLNTILEKNRCVKSMCEYNSYCLIYIDAVLLHRM